MTEFEKMFVPMEIGAELREIGFDEYCIFYHEHGKPVPRFGIESKIIKNKNHFRIIKLNAYSILKSKNSKIDIAIPSYEQVFAWFRKKGLYGNIEAGSKYNSIYIFSDNDLDMGSNIYPTYEEAREELLKRLIKIYKNENFVPDIEEKMV